MSQARLPSFPPAQQAQIIRANQRDLYHVSSLREQTESLLRSWLGTRWLTRWDKEVDALVKLGYFGLTTGRAIQTLGEEYTDIWQHSASSYRPPSASARAALILLPTLPSYILSRWGTVASAKWPWLKILLTLLDVTSEANLALFYLRGTYYDLSKRSLGIRHMSSIPENPHTQPPSYSLLGVLLAVRLLYRLMNALRSIVPSEPSKGKEKQLNSSQSSHETYLDSTPISTFLGPSNPESEPAKPAEQDTRTALTISSISPALRAGRRCTLCLEERTDSCATECGHLFCWTCIVGWGREKAECPLCRQGLKLSGLLPIYNL